MDLLTVMDRLNWQTLNMCRGLGVTLTLFGSRHTRDAPGPKKLVVPACYATHQPSAHTNKQIDGEGSAAMQSTLSQGTGKSDDDVVPLSAVCAIGESRHCIAEYGLGICVIDATLRTL